MPGSQLKVLPSSTLAVTEGVALEAPATAGIFPGAFRKELLLGACASASTYKNPLTPDDAYRGVAQLMPAIKEMGSLFVRFDFYKAAQAAMRGLATEDESGERLKAYEDVLIALHLGANKKLGEPEIRLLKEGAIRLASATFQEMPADLFAALADKANIVNPHTESKEKDTATKVVFSVIQSDGSSAPPPTEARNIAEFPRTLSVEKIDVLETATKLAIRAHLYRAIETTRFYTRKDSTRVEDQLRADLKTFADYCNNQAVSQIGSLESADVEVVHQSPAMRAVHLVSGLSSINNKHEAVRQKMAKAYEQNPFCGPKVLFIAGLGRLFDSDIQQIARTDFTPADDAMCDETSFLLMLDHGRLQFAHIRYDFERGKLCTDHNVDVAMELGRGFAPPAQGRYAWIQLARIVNLFPFVDYPMLDRVIDGLEQDADFNEYLGDKKNRYGPQLLPNKNWLEGDKTDKGFIKFLSEVCQALKGEGPGPKISFKQMGNQLASILCESYFMNAQGEFFLKHFIQAACESAGHVKDFRLEKYGSHSAFEWLENLEQREMLLGVGLVFDLKDDQAKSKGVKLTEFGVEYIINLIDPNYKFHHKGSDCRELEEAKARMNRQYR